MELHYKSPVPHFRRLNAVIGGGITYTPYVGQLTGLLQPLTLVPTIAQTGNC